MKQGQTGCPVIQLFEAAYCKEEKEMNLFDRDDYTRTSHPCLSY